MYRAELKMSFLNSSVSTTLSPSPSRNTWLDATWWNDPLTENIKLSRGAGDTPAYPVPSPDRTHHVHSLHLMQRHIAYAAHSRSYSNLLSLAASLGPKQGPLHLRWANFLSLAASLGTKQCPLHLRLANLLSLAASLCTQKIGSPTPVVGQFVKQSG